MPNLRPHRTWASLAALALMTACGDSKDATGAQAAQSTPQGDTSAASTQRISGQAAMGPLRGAWVNAFSIRADGTFGDNLGAATTQTDGSFALDVVIPGGAAVAFTVQGGTYVDEATGNDVTIALEAGAEGRAEAAQDANVLQTWVGDIKSTTQVAVTALTTMAAGFARQAITSGQTDIAAAIGHGKTQVASFFADANGQTLVDFDISATLPLDLTVQASGSIDSHRANYGALLSGISQLVHNTTKDAAQGLSVITQLVAVTRQDLKAFAQASAQARADGSTPGNSIDASLLTASNLQALAQLGAQIVRALPIAINQFLKESPRVQVRPPDPPQAPPGRVISGTAWANGPLANATVRAAVLAPDGRLWDAPQVAAATTDANGAFSLRLYTDKWVRLVTQGGTYSDFVFDGNATVALTAQDSFSVDVDPLAADANGTLNVAINPVTTLVSSHLSALLAGGAMPPPQAKFTAQGAVRTALGLGGGYDLWRQQAVALTGQVGANAYGGAQVALASAAISRALKDLNLPPATFGAAVRALAHDMADGRLNAMDGAGAAVTLEAPAGSYRDIANRLNEGAMGVLDSLTGLLNIEGQIRISFSVSLPPP